MYGQAAFVMHPANSPMSRPGEIYMTSMPGGMSIQPGGNGKAPSSQGGKMETDEDRKERERLKKKEDFRSDEKNKRLFRTPDARPEAKTLDDVVTYVNERRDELESEQLVNFIKNHPDIGMRSAGPAASCARTYLRARVTGLHTLLRVAAAPERPLGTAPRRALTYRALTCVRLRPWLCGQVCARWRLEFGTTTRAHWRQALRASRSWMSSQWQMSLSSPYSSRSWCS